MKKENNTKNKKSANKKLDSKNINKVNGGTWSPICAAKREMPVRK